MAQETELAQVQQCLTMALSGTHQMAFITGEAGIGKTALADAFMAQEVSALLLLDALQRVISQVADSRHYRGRREALPARAR